MVWLRPVQQSFSFWSSTTRPCRGDVVHIEKSGDRRLMLLGHQLDVPFLIRGSFGNDVGEAPVRYRFPYLGQ